MHPVNCRTMSKFGIKKAPINGTIHNDKRNIIPLKANFILGSSALRPNNANEILFVNVIVFKGNVEHTSKAGNNTTKCPMTFTQTEFWSPLLNPGKDAQFNDAGASTSDPKKILQKY